MERVFTIIALVFLTILILYNISNLCRGREKRIYYVKNFKKGFFFVIYLIAVLVFFIGVKEHNLVSFITCINYSVKLLVLELNYSAVKEYADSDMLYRITLFITYVYAIFSFFLLSASIAGQNIINSIARWKKLRSKDITLIYGYSQESVDIAISNKKCSIVIDKLTKEAKDNLYINKISYIDISQGGLKKIDYILKRLSNNINKRIIFIINNKDFEDKMKCSINVAELVKKVNYEYNNADEFQNGLNVYILSNETEITSLKSYIKDTKGRIRMIDKYDLIAINFVSKFPITKYMNDEYIDYNTGAIKKDKEIDMVYIGFGDTNKRLFLTEFANNALYTIDNDKLVAKKINYIFYDKECPKNNLDLNHSIFRYFLEKNNYSKDVDLPDISFDYSDEMFKTMNINDNNFYNDLLKNINENYTYIHICIGNDIANINLAKKIAKKITEHNNHKVKLFVRVRSNELAKGLSNEQFEIYGTNEVVSNISNIVYEKYSSMALDRHTFYSAEYIKENNQKVNVIIENVAKDALDEWQSYEYPRRMSNVYSCLNLRLKLNLIGYDLVEVYDETNAISFDEFMDKYASDNEVKYKDYIISGKKVVDYSGDYMKQSLRNNLARQEHLRWNYYMLMSGFIPTGGIKKERDFDKRIHWNLTTYEGLLIQEEVSSIIKYDYQIMDDAYWLITKHGMKIVKKN